MIWRWGRCLEPSAQGLAWTQTMTSLLFSAIPPSFLGLVFPSYKRKSSDQRASSSDLCCFEVSSLPRGSQSPFWAPVSSFVYLCTRQAGLDSHSGILAPYHQSSPNVYMKRGDTGRPGSRTGLWLKTCFLMHRWPGVLPGHTHPLTRAP